MRDTLAVINTRPLPGAEEHQWTSRFNGFPVERKPLKRFGSCFSKFTGLKPGVNESAARKPLQLVVILMALFFASAVFAAQTQDAEYDGVAEEYVKTYLAAHPLQGT